MKILSSILLLLATAEAYQTASSRRDVFRSVASAAFVGVIPAAANAIEACPKGSNNCIRTTWTPPAGTSKSDAASQIKTILESYPQEGQEKVDLGGWSFASDSLASSGTASVEYKSGIGNFAKFLNGGKPFVDDLVVEVGDDGTAQVRSSSRVGDSDFKVNQKRLEFFATKLTAAGWTAPAPAY
ncbi:expressed unknown protein [Seminavis robusta]|uniref:DUF1499 domain-containing protein n=1 Tax=Seminavis robusta TaxID=568900 RepID=A0A9N8ETS0_9STRA|nr:expressed unknown protein [Seminavis robusta]|eukprot:Sro1943_g306800.1 n/a (184) ;mRNA; r:2323-2971